MENINNKNLIETINISHLIIIDALSEKDLQTGRLLKEDLLHIFEVKHIKVNNEKELDNCLLEIESSFRDDNFLPILHFEGHGDEKHFSFPDNSHKEWGKLAKCISYLNKLCNNNLLVFIASCHGIRFIHSSTHKSHLNHFAPCNTAIGPTEAINTVDLLNSTTLFYKKLFEKNDIDLAISCLPEKSFEVFKSRQIFIVLMINIYKKFFMGKGKHQRHEEMLTEINNSDTFPAFESITSARKLVKENVSTPTEFEHILDKYGKSYLGPNYSKEKMMLFNEINLLRSNTK